MALCQRIHSRSKRPELLKRSFRERGCQCLVRTTAYDFDLYCAIGRGFIQQPLQFANAVDASSVERHNHVIFLETGFVGWAVCDYFHHYSAALFLEIQLFGAFRRDLFQIDSEVTSITTQIESQRAN